MWPVQPLPDHLRNVRVRALLSQRALAEKAGVSASTIALLEAGRPAPTPVLQTMRRICSALGVQATEIIEFQRALDNRTVPPDQQVEL